MVWDISLSLKIMNRFAAILVFSTVAFTSSKALAEANSVAGVASAIFSSTTSSDFASTFSGYVVVAPPTGAVQTFFWGGTRCPSSSIVPITSTQLQMLSDAVINKRTITMFYKQPAGFPCITGFAIF